MPEFKPNLTERARVARVAHLVKAIYVLESSGGKNDGCVRDGRGVNGFGYRQNKREFVCFDSHERVEGLVTRWVEDKLEKNYTIPELLCYYNQGERVKMCPYYNNYLKLQ